MPPEVNKKVLTQNPEFQTPEYVTVGKLIDILSKLDQNAKFAISSDNNKEDWVYYDDEIDLLRCIETITTTKGTGEIESIVRLSLYFL